MLDGERATRRYSGKTRFGDVQDEKDVLDTREIERAHTRGICIIEIDGFGGLEMEVERALWR